LLELQALFDPFNRGGSALTVEGGPHEEPIPFGVVDSYQVIRVKGDQFWLLLKEIGYQAEPQYSHDVKVVSWTQDDTWLLDLVDHLDRRYHIELIFPELDVEQYKQWQRWQRYKYRHRKRFLFADKTILEQSIQAANEWDQRA